MKFTLTYDGALPSDGKSRIKRAKHEIRRQLHPQLKQPWRHKPLEGNENWMRQGAAEEDDDDGFLLSTIDGHNFVSIVHPHLKVCADLDILLLRPGPPGSIVLKGGDIDNRLKTLLDALRAPDKSQEIPENWRPTADEQPLFCLLQDDQLISRMTVETDRLLVPDFQSSHVKLVIRITIKAIYPTWGNLIIA